MGFKRIDAIEINYADSASHEDLKIGTTRGAGEWRLYAGHNEANLDEFFEFEYIESFFMLKEDLLKYLQDAKDEYLNPSQEYRGDITRKYDSNLQLINSIESATISIKFRKTYDNQHRYYVVLQRGVENRKKYSYLRDICLSRLTIITFVKLEDESTHKKYIYFKPIFYFDPTEKQIKEQKEIVDEKKTETQKQTYRKKQTKYRLALLEKMPACLITAVSDDRVLVACHVKPYSVCVNEEEQYDVKNGIVLTPTYHTLFDLGFITFGTKGQLIISPFLSNLNKTRLNLHEGKAYRLPNGTETYMKYHREHVFNTINFNEFDFVD